VCVCGGGGKEKEATESTAQLVRQDTRQWGTTQLTTKPAVAGQRLKGGGARDTAQHSMAGHDAAPHDLSWMLFFCRYN
jgi:hypothetical protein